MNIRNFVPEDAEKVKSLILSILTSEYPFDKKAFSESDLNNIKDIYSGARDLFLVIEADGELIGTMAIKEEGSDSALIRRFFVASDYRRKGYGRKLMEEAITFCKSKEYKNIVFQGTDKMTRATELCKKMGFTEREHIDMGGFFIQKFVLDM